MTPPEHDTMQPKNPLAIPIRTHPDLIPGDVEKAISVLPAFRPLKVRQPERRPNTSEGIPEGTGGT